jgi:hypothetical protein
MFIATRQEQSRQGTRRKADTGLSTDQDIQTHVLPTVITCSEAEIAQRYVIAGAAALNVRLLSL